MSVGVEMCSGTDNGIDSVANGVAHRQVDNQIVETAVGGAQVLCINTLVVVRAIILATHWRTSQMSVCIKACSGTDNGMDCVADGVVDCEVYYKIMEAAVGCTQVLCVNALIVVRTVVHTTHGRASHVSVGVVTCSSTDDGMNGVADGVVDS